MPTEGKEDIETPRKQPASGWGEDNTSRGVILTLEQNKPKQEEKVDDEIMIIPDIEDLQEEEKMVDVAEAPQVKTFRVQGIDELKKAGQSNLPLAYDPGVDLTILVTHFLQENMIEEPKNAWDFDQLLQDVKQGIRIDEEKNGIDDGKDDKTNPIQNTQ